MFFLIFSDSFGHKEYYFTSSEIYSTKVLTYFNVATGFSSYVWYLDFPYGVYWYDSSLLIQDLYKLTYLLNKDKYDWNYYNTYFSYAWRTLLPMLLTHYVRSFYVDVVFSK